MIAVLNRVWGAVRGTGDAALTVPAMDGAFMANTAIDGAGVALTCAAPDNLVATAEALYFSSGGTVFRYGTPPVVVAEGTPVTALAADAEGRLIVARTGTGPARLTGTGEVPLFSGTGPKGDITAMTVLEDGSIAFCVGAGDTSEADWPRDFLRRGSSGSVWRGMPGGAPEMLAGDLAYPNGIVADDSGGLVVSLAWRSSLLRLAPGGKAGTLLHHLPGYPARIVQASDGGYWLSLFAPRNQFLEFVLREPRYVRRMIAEVPPEHWVVPRLHPEIGPLDPMLEGCTKKGSAIKPWAPSFSYGLVAHLRPDFTPDRSLHSRANGRRHGIRSAAEWRGDLYIASRGGDAILRLPEGPEGRA